MNTRIARANDFCSDVTDPSTCGIVGPFDSGSPRSDTLASVAPGENVLVRYVATNVGSTRLSQVDITDTERGAIFSSTTANLAPFDSVVVNRIYPGPTTAGLTTARASADARDAGGNPAPTRTDIYGIQGQGPALQLITLVGLAAEFCTDPTDVTTCGFERLPATPLSEQGDRQVVVYRAFNTGTEDFVSHTLRDDVTGPVFIDSTFTLSPLDSVSVFRLTQDVPTLGTDRQATWTTVTGSGDVIEADAVETPLPVEMTRFDAVVAVQRVTLQWKTVSETNNAGFDVQQYTVPPGAAADAGMWRTLAFVEGAGTTDETRTYAYDITDLTPNVYRFRLLQRDFDGTTALSDVIEVEVALDAPYQIVGPAPHPIASATSAATVELVVREAQPVTVTLYDMLGRRVALIHNGPLPANRPQTLTLPVDGLSSGTYFLRVSGTQFRATKRITVMR
jgi:hypothetical protein